jgi:cell division protein FtsB
LKVLHFLLASPIRLDMIRIMNGVANITRRYGHTWFTSACLLIVGYFALHSFQGNGSISALKELERQQVVLEQEAESISANKRFLENQVAKMGGASIDPDLLEELVREKLGFTHPDEVVVLLD